MTFFGSFQAEIHRCFSFCASVSDSVEGQTEEFVGHPAFIFDQSEEQQVSPILIEPGVEKTVEDVTKFTKMITRPTRIGGSHLG